MQGLPNILVIEDDRGIAGALSQALAQNYEVDIAYNGKQGIYKSDCREYHAVLLDLNLPDLAGLEVCQQLRERGNNSPIIVVTAENKILTKINLLDAGADDYLTKPFSLGELKARLRVCDRKKTMTSAKPMVLQAGELELNATTYQVSRNGQPVELRRKEFKLLACLMENAGSVVKRESLIAYAWQGLDLPWKNTVDVHIKYLRDKIDRPFGTSLIKTVHGIGYRLDCQPAKISEPVHATDSCK
jgi:two-component system OmpR family response regulator